MNRQPIGVFDSGLGGLTAVKELISLLPNENIIYLCDNARVPYGTKSHDTILRYAKEDISFLKTQDVKLIIVACGTVSSALSVEPINDIDIPIISVVKPAAKAAINKSRNNKIGVIGTPATVKNGCYERTIKEFSDAEVFSKACTLFVPLVEAGHFGENDPLATLAAEEYLPEFKEKGVDTLILGCTHYPLLSDVIKKILPNTELINSGAETAKEAKELLEKNNLLNDSTSEGTLKCFVTDNIEGFNDNAFRFLGKDFKQSAELTRL